MMGCPIGIDWAVTHLNGRVRISDVVKYETTDEEQAARYPGLEVEIPFAEYRDAVVAFAKGAKEPFEGLEKSFSDDTDRQDYANFWTEYDRLLDHAVRKMTSSRDS